jgi:hypothetical protein
VTKFILSKALHRSQEDPAEGVGDRQQRKLVKNLPVHNKAPLHRTDFVADLRKSLEEKEEAVATDARERDSLARYLAELERAGKEMAQVLKRHIETRPNFLKELKALSTRLAGKLDGISKRLKSDECAKISRVVKSVEKALHDQAADLESSDKEAQSALRKFAVAKEKADETEEERNRVLELLSDKSEQLNQARALQNRIETVEAKNPELAWALSLELKRLLNRLKGPSVSASEKRLNTIWKKWREDSEALRQAALSRDAAAARFERERIRLGQALKNKDTLVESALSNSRRTRGFQLFLTLPQK